MRSAEPRASGVSMFCASFISRAPSASISWRSREASDRILSASASASASGAHGGAAIVAAAFSASAAIRMPQRLALGLLRRADQLDRLPPLGHLGLADGEHLLLRRHRVRARRFGRGLRLGLRLATAGRRRSRDAARRVSSAGAARSRAAAISRSLPMRSLVEPRSVGDARALDLLARDDLRPARPPARARPARARARRAGRRGAISISRSWLRRALSASRSMSSESFSVSRFLLRISIIVSCSMSLRSSCAARSARSAASGPRRRRRWTG